MTTRQPLNLTDANMDGALPPLGTERPPPRSIALASKSCEKPSSFES